MTANIIALSHLHFFLFSAPIKGEKGRKITGLKGDEMEGVDQGGPTSQFISEFCMQLGDLCVYLPIRKDAKNSDEMIDTSRHELDHKYFLLPKKDDQVFFNDRIAKVKNYQNEAADLIFEDNCEEVSNVRRADFVVTKIAIPLFDKQTGGLVPQMDVNFQNEHDKSRPFGPTMDVEAIKEKAKLYYRAVGRFLLHVFADGRNTIPSTVMPALFQNGELMFCSILLKCQLYS